MPEPLTHLRCSALVLRLTVQDMKGDEMAEEIREQLLTQYEVSQAVNVVIDFQEVTYLSSAGFRPLLSLQRKVRERGGRLVLCCLDPKVEDTFSVTRLIRTVGSPRSTFEVQPDVPAAVASLYRSGEA